jgi:hypothetical protein
MKNLELAQCVDHLKDENNKLCEVLSWLSSQESQLGMMIASCKRFDGWALGFDKFGGSSGEREGKFGNVSVPPQSTHKDKFAPKPNQSLKTREKPSEKRVRKLVRSFVKSLIPILSLDQFGSIVTFVERMVTRESFASRGSERRELRRSGLTRTSTTLPMVYLSLMCSCPGPRRV